MCVVTPGTDVLTSATICKRGKEPTSVTTSRQEVLDITLILNNVILIIIIRY